MDATSLWAAVAVAGAWIAGLAILFAILAFCFGTVRPALLRSGVIYLFVTDAGLALMFIALLVIQNDAVLWTFSLIALITLALLTAIAVITIRTLRIRGEIPQVNTLVDATRQRIEF